MIFMKRFANEVAGKEKHIPIVKDMGEGAYQISVGEVPHPMTPDHYIEWVEVLTDKNRKIVKFFSPNDKPEFTVMVFETIVSVSAYCNIHGLWGI
jgi:superoxide reductase